MACFDCIDMGNVILSRFSHAPNVLALVSCQAMITIPELCPSMLLEVDAIKVILSARV